MVDGTLLPMLTVRDHMTLQLEAGGHWKHLAAKESHVRHVFSESLTRYYQRLNRLLDCPHAHATYPATVARLRRLRDVRRAARTTQARGTARSDP